MNFLIVGCGSIAKRHLKNLLQVGIKSQDIALFDPSAERLKEMSEPNGIPKENTFTTLDAALAARKTDAAMVCCPTAFHTQNALKLVQNKVHIFMEKPIAADDKGLDNVLSLVADNQLVFAVGYIFRFHPGFKKVKELLDSGAIGTVYGARVECGQYLPDWHPWEDYRGFYMSKKNEGGGALLDISH